MTVKQMCRALIISLLCFFAASSVLAANGTKKIVRLTVGSSIAQSEARECGRCHSTEFSLWVSHPHSRALLDPKRDKEFIAADFSEDAKGYDKYVKEYFTQRTVAMAFGVSRTQVFWKKTEAGHELLPAMWRMASRRWEPLPAFLEEVREAGTTWEEACAGCHSSGFNPEDNTFAAPAVSCRACHGDGAEHISQGGLGKIGQPDDLSVERRSELCGACHSRGTQAGGKHKYPVGFEPGTPLADVFVPAKPVAGEVTDLFWPDGTERSFYMEYQGFVASDHYKAGMSCTTCHLPHGSDAQQGLRRVTEDLCSSCHEPGKTPSPAHAGHPTGEAGCVDCHMSIVNPGASPLEVRTHTFRFLEPANGVKWKMPDSCTTSCHEKQSADWAARKLESWRK